MIPLSHNHRSSALLWEDLSSSSLHSTVCVEDALHNSKETTIASPQSSTRRSKSVHFDEKCLEECECGDSDKNVLFDDEVGQIWYNSREYETFRHEMNQSIETIQEMEDIFQETYPLSYRNVLEQVWQACCHHSALHDCANDSEASSCEQDPTKHVPVVYQQALRTLFVNSGDENVNLFRLGLEKLSTETIRSDMRQRRQRLYQVVERFQETDFGWSNNDEMEDCLARASQRITRASQWFVTLLAQAQADAATGRSSASR